MPTLLDFSQSLFCWPTFFFLNKPKLLTEPPQSGQGCWVRTTRLPSAGAFAQLPPGASLIRMYQNFLRGELLTAIFPFFFFLYGPLGAGNPKPPFVEPWGSAEPRLRNTALTKLIKTPYQILNFLEAKIRICGRKSRKIRVQPAPIARRKNKELPRYLQLWENSSYQTF